MSLEETTKLNIKNGDDDIEKKVEPDSKPAAAEPSLWIKLRDVSCIDTVLFNFIKKCSFGGCRICNPQRLKSSLLIEIYILEPE